MTRSDVEKEYTVIDGSIISKGKFEGEPVFAPYFWDLCLRGMADYETDFGDCQFAIGPADVHQFPELGKAKTITLAELESGSVVTTTSE